VLSVFDRTDEAIRKEINDDVLIGGFLVDPRSLEVTVKDGIVTLAGRPETNDVGHDIIQRVRHLQGVVAVRDRFDYPPAERPGDTFDVLARFPMD
jgi:osmotically-inducible protein OsmY